MFLPLFIAILLGLATPANTNHSASCGGTTTVNTADTDPTDPGDTDPTDPGDDGTGGDTGQNPPR
ncbi:hypothetical protein [Pedobacter sp. ISL-64]|uniref:hypothetical protein n=1 Tax=Pedobacter sp. ISL-64 TaxID=2819164 RepID=UPI001BEAA2E1|nr:hypothetical protein [Pedobacter sp. ISL-64]MBT2562548.1 hypothetical protein [Pedobacter sp. ISL-64]